MGGIPVAQLGRMKTLRFHVLALTAAFLALSGVAHAGSLTLAWDASPDPAVFGYRLYWGTAPGQYTSSLDVRTATTMTVNNLVDGRAYYFVVRAYNALNTESAPSVEVSRRIGVPRATSSDFSGDGRSDIGVFRPSTGGWLLASGSYVWGGPGDLPVVGDYDGDARMDIALFRPSTGRWYVAPSSGQPAFSYLWGGGTDVPVQGDYDGDGKTDVGVFRPATGEWFIIGSRTQTALQ